MGSLFISTKDFIGADDLDFRRRFRQQKKIFDIFNDNIKMVQQHFLTKLVAEKN